MTAARRILVFDAYGTLFDVHAVMRGLEVEIGADWRRVSETWRAKQLEYAWVYSATRRMRPFREVTREGLLAALVTHGVDDRIADRALERYRQLPPFAEAADVLRALKARGDRLAILSNADKDMLAELVERARLSDSFERLLSVAPTGAYKPAPDVYQLAVDALCADAAAMHFVSSNRWDVAGAKAFGFQTIWINRDRRPEEYPGLGADQEFTDLRGLLSD